MIDSLSIREQMMHLVYYSIPLPHLQCKTPDMTKHFPYFSSFLPPAFYFSAKCAKMI